MIFAMIPDIHVVELGNERLKCKGMVQNRLVVDGRRCIDMRILQGAIQNP